jgi:hypothetical protein
MERVCCGEPDARCWPVQAIERPTSIVLQLVAGEPDHDRNRDAAGHAQGRRFPLL